MAVPKPVAGYESLTAAVVDLGGQGLEPVAIAERLGSTPRIVRALLWQAFNRAERRRSARASREPVFLPQDVRSALQAAAKARGMSANRLARQLLTQVLRDGLVDAVMDDETKADGKSEQGGQAA